MPSPLLYFVWTNYKYYRELSQGEIYYITPEKKLRIGFFMNMKTFSRDKIFTKRDKTSEVNCSKYPRHFRKVEQKYFLLLIIMITHTQWVLHHSPQVVGFPGYYPLVSIRIHHCNIWEPLQIRMTDSIALDHLLRQIFLVILFFSCRKICNNQGLNFKKKKKKEIVPPQGAEKVSFTAST